MRDWSRGGRINAASIEWIATPLHSCDNFQKILNGVGAMGSWFLLLLPRYKGTFFQARYALLSRLKLVAAPIPLQ